MSEPTSFPDFYGSLDDLVNTANQLLPRFMPDIDRDARVTDLVNPRLVRHYTSENLIDPPQKEGREARYTRRHLLQLLTLRKLMTGGLSAGSAGDVLRNRSDLELEMILQSGWKLNVTPDPKTHQGGSSPNHDRRFALIAGAVGLNSVVGALAVPTTARLKAAALANKSKSTHDESVQRHRWTHVELEPGFEVHLRDDYQSPKTPAERERIAKLIMDLLAQHKRK
ncbi:MerR family transcriptional regulator [Deinococcus yavapaiensis]|uniref:MerR-like DNA binding protein n=1 Tax=Deinococcus yavapaiensis KR-236 TaxID=694435 RepID=A0A318SLS7_9DEIO|nr:MerR family transcriptional regulator [Deinococcus yavapaiensis]PYE55489.1 MerR-like DNA binding protein [Deinococcus yavapaiensis KR-236]